MPWISLRPEDFIATLEKSGEVQVRDELARGDKWVTHAGRDKVAEAWLTELLKSRETDIALSAAMREERALKNSSSANTLAAEANRIALEANSIARRAERWAMWAAIIAIIATAK